MATPIKTNLHEQVNHPYAILNPDIGAMHRMVQPNVEAGAVIGGGSCFCGGRFGGFAGNNMASFGALTQPRNKSVTEAAKLAHLCESTVYEPEDHVAVLSRSWLFSCGMENQ